MAFMRMPLTMRAGLLITGLGGALDIGYHALSMPQLLGDAGHMEDSDRARVIGFFVHLVNGQIFALFYAAGFALLDRATWWLGAIFGAFHGLAALTLIIPLLPGIHSRMASERAGPELVMCWSPRASWL